MLLISKAFNFEAAHRLHKYNGDCARLHGHSYHGEAVFKVNQLNKLGIAIDFKTVKKILDEVIISKYDHRAFEDFKTNSTAEMQVLYFAEKLLKATEGSEEVTLISIKLYETVGSYAKWINPGIFDGRGSTAAAQEIAQLTENVKTLEELDNE